MDYFTFDGVNSAEEYGLYVVNRDNSNRVNTITPSKTTTTETVLGKQGQIPVHQKYNIREIPLKLYLENSNDLTLFRQISGWLGQLYPKSFSLSYEPYKVYNATCEDQLDFVYFSDKGTFDLTFIAHDPFGYSTFTTMDIADGLVYDQDELFYYDSGLLYEEDMISNNLYYRFANITTPVMMNIYHGGSCNYCYPKITIFGSWDDITLTNNLTGQSLSYGAVSNQYLVIDCERKNVFKGNGVDALVMNNFTFSYTDDDWMNLMGKTLPTDTGINPIELTGTNLNIQSIEFEFRFVYL